MKSIVRILIAVSLSLPALRGDAQHLVSVTKIESKTAAQVDALFNSLFGTTDAPHYAVNTYKILYNTIDVFNNPTIASGALMIPESIPCDTFPLLSFDHGTVLAKSQVPSQLYNDNVEGYFFSGKGYVVTQPDYLGLGVNPGYHPYLHDISEATATIDMMRAAKEYLKDSTNIILDGQVFITGYSQGGHAAMATLKYIQDNSLLSEFNVAAGAPMSGPYSLSVAEASYLDTISTYIPYIVNSYQYVYSNLYTNISAYYLSPYDTTILPYFDGAYTLGQLAAILPPSPFLFMQDTVLTDFLTDTITFSDPLRHDMKLNDNYAWAPSMPLRLCYCTADNVVKYTNSVMAYDTMTARGATEVSLIDVGPTLDHSDCELPAIYNVRTWFNSFRTDCSNSINVGISEYSSNDKFDIYPNPASGFVTIHAKNMIKEMDIMDANGKVIYKTTNVNSTIVQLKASTLENGFYIIRLTDENGSIYANKLILLK